MNDPVAVTVVAREFARLYCALVEALMMEGVPEHIARLEARAVAASIIIIDECDDGAD